MGHELKSVLPTYRGQVTLSFILSNKYRSMWPIFMIYEHHVFGLCVNA